MIRTHDEVKGNKIWFFVHMDNNQLKLISPDALFGSLYARYRRNDGNLYIHYSDINIAP